MDNEQQPGDSSASAPHFVADPGPDETRAWEEIETGRYMPRRIRGSFKGRALG